MTQRNLFADSPRFDGPHLEPDDHPRLNTQLKAVRDLMSNGEPWTLPQLVQGLESMGIHAMESGVSARIRDLRKEKFGGYTIETKLIKRGLFQYRMKA